MKIDILYKNGATDQLTTTDLTEAAGVQAANGSQSIMTKFHINWAEFVSNKINCNLNIYIYYYRRNNDRGSCITNRNYLDKILFYENDQPMYANLSSEQIKQKGKALPYGAMEPGSWFTIIPLELRSDILQVYTDDELMLHRMYENDELVDLSKLSYFENSYGLTGGAEGIGARIQNLYAAISNKLNKNPSTIKTLDEIAFEVGIPLDYYDPNKKIEDKKEKNNEELENSMRRSAEKIHTSCTDNTLPSCEPPQPQH